MNELRQTRDAVYNPPVSHDERMNERLVGDIYVILDEEGQPAVACDDVACLIQARPEWSAQAIESHFDASQEQYVAPNGEVVHQVRRRKGRVWFFPTTVPDLNGATKKPRRTEHRGFLFVVGFAAQWLAR